MLKKRRITFGDVESLELHRLGVVDHGREVGVYVGGGPGIAITLDVSLKVLVHDGRLGHDQVVVGRRLLLKILEGIEVVTGDGSKEEEEEISEHCELTFFSTLMLVCFLGRFTSAISG